MTGTVPMRGLARRLLVIVLFLVAACGKADERRLPPMFDDLNQATFAPSPQTGSGDARVVSGAAQVEGPIRPAQVYPGTDRMAVQPLPTGRPVEVVADGVQLNFVDTDLREVLQLVLGDVLRKPYVLDPRIQGTVTVSSQGPISREDLLATLETILRMNGAALVQEGSGYRIVPSVEAVGGRTIVQLGGDTRPLPPGYGVSIVPLRNVSASAIAPLIAPVSNPELIRVDPTRNIVLISGSSAERAAIVETIAAFDVDWMRGMSAGIFPLRRSSPEAVIGELVAIFGGAPQSGPLQGLIQFLPIERLNAVLVVTPQASRLREAETWIARLDQGDRDGSQVYVYYVQNGTAENLASVLTQAFGGQGGGAGPSRSERSSTISPSLDPVVMSSGSSDSTFDEVAPISFEDPTTSGYGDAGGGVGGGGGAAGGAFELGDEGEVRIVADKDKNALLIMATPAAWRMIESALRAIDTTPYQVLIEATIAEVTLNDVLRYGVQFFLEQGDIGVGFTQSREGTDIAPAVPGFNFIISGSNAQVILTAISSVTDVKIVSAPSLAVLDNQTARLQVGDQVPVVTREAVAVDDPDAPVVNSIEYRDTGVILEVTPRINSNGQVSMEIEQEVSSVSPNAEDPLTPTIAQRRIGSVVSVANGQTVVLGGLISETQNVGDSSVPVLSDIPLIGEIFTSSTSERRRTELIVFITPKVIRNAGDAQAVAQELRSRMEGLRPETP